MHISIVQLLHKGLFFFLIPVVLLCEYEVYRLLYPRQGVLRSILTSLYANTISGAAGFLIGKTLDDIAIDISQDSAEIVYQIICFLLFFLATWFIEAIAVKLLHKKLKIHKVFIGTFIVNIASYTILAIMVLILHFFR